MSWQSFKIACRQFKTNHPLIVYGGSTAAAAAIVAAGIYHMLSNNNGLSSAGAVIPPFDKMPAVPTETHGVYFGGTRQAESINLKLKSYDPATGLVKFESDSRTFVPYKEEGGQYSLGVVTELSFPVGKNQDIRDNPIIKYVPQNAALEDRIKRHKVE